MAKNIEDLQISYYGVRINVSHSFYKPVKSKPGRIRYTFNFPTQPVTIEQLLDINDKFYWNEVGKGETDFAADLGGILEHNQSREENESVDDENQEYFGYNILKDIEITYKGKIIIVSHSIQPKEPNDTGNIVYTYKIDSDFISIRQFKDGKKFFWKEMPGGPKTDLAQDLGKLLEEYYLNK